MPQPGPVADYLALLASELRFDPALARRVQGEVEDHLWEATEARGGRSDENQLEAVLVFGEPRELARGYAATSLLTQIRYAGLAVILCVAATVLVMKGRVAWYAWMGWQPNTDLATASALLVDRYATMLTIIAALIASLYIATRRAPLRIDWTYRKELDRCIVLCGVSASVLSVAIAAEVLVNGIRLWGMQWCPAMLVPALSLTVELAAIAGCVLSIRKAVRHIAFARSLLRD